MCEAYPRHAGAAESPARSCSSCWGHARAQTEFAHAEADNPHDHDDEHHPAPVPRDPDLPQLSDASLSFFAAGALVVFVVALLTLI